jgi:hypothetical protein
LIHQIGLGDSISIWNDSWILGAEMMRPMGKLQETDKEYVHELFSVGSEPVGRAAGQVHFLGSGCRLDHTNPFASR